MTKKVNPKLLKEIKKYGAFDISACFNCGNCSAVCPLSKEELSFPRVMIRHAQIGDKQSILSSLEPWMCYYCGECSSTCPRDASPGEFMMSLRRYLISEYDITGISKIFYRFPYIQNIFVIFIFAIALITFLKFNGDFGSLAAKIELVFPFYITLYIISYLFIMYKKTILDRLKKFVVSLNPSNIKNMIVHGFTQKNFIACSEKDYVRWFSHLLVMSGYILTLIISNLHILEPLKKQYLLFTPLSVLIYYSSLSLIAGGSVMIFRRLFKKGQSSKFSHSTDWLFVIMLFLIGLSLFLTYTSNIVFGADSNLLEIIYKINIAIEISWILIVVPFTKWIHMFFRPFAIYLNGLKKENSQVIVEEI
ncbi:MAG: 4Fe-4S dicluster domain-containing protein [Elusimicrobia bacterium]|nr:4Fe-4S dicluster domain-containing protein [Elusimicrobiota bacterium]